MIKQILNRASKWAHSITHFGKLGRVAATRSFLRKERKKLLVKLGERTMEWAQRHAEASPEVKRIVEQIQKVDTLLSKLDYGGEGGVDFVDPQERASRRAPKKKPSKSEPDD